ncbi:DUF4349 domain-containing protein [Microbacterium sp. NEAU-LLC]|uniref:DUF4349 domain-containing protein n=1 Tax=Microbacterium helvum TaxID=2773713 RepID=A0ABR8NLP3_9MICO|nr:DUF4349 domain-containing protein [Microbacterium helvum]MBD3941590.1 DUF4349 domain-containing protein [Microbacterium helvum]
MNTQPRDPQGAASLPELSPQRIDEIEDALFADIARERVRDTARRRRRGRLWIAGGAAAAVIVVAAVIAPTVGALVTPTGAGDSAAVAPADSGAFESNSGSRDGSAPPAEASDQASGIAADTGGATAGRDIVTTASASVTVEDVDAAARTIADTAAQHGGYVESMSVGTDGSPVDPAQSGVTDGVIAPDAMPYPSPTDGGWITVRVPADELTAVLGTLDDLGTVTATNVDRQDVTSQTVDLQARIDAAQASMDRLTALMGQAGSVSDLIAAESALSERQALLESYQQQLKLIDDQVAMSTLSVTLTPESAPVSADPAGFTDGLAAGWNGLVATLNGIVVALGFLIPWIAVAAVAALIVWLIVRGRRRRRRASDAATAEGTASRDDAA